MKLMLVAFVACVQTPSANNTATERVASLPPVTIHTGIAGWISLGLTALLVGVGIAGVIVAICSLRRIDRQTKATEKAAEAAKGSANAFIRENRPWLLLCKDIGTVARYSSLEPRIHNFGKTPAKITALQIKVDFGEEKEIVPHPEFFAKAERSGPFILPQGEGWTQSFDLREYRVFDEQRIAKGELHLWLCGLIRYQDTFDSPERAAYETRFCYHYGAGLAWQIGPPEYNCAT